MKKIKKSKRSRARLNLVYDNYFTFAEKQYQRFESNKNEEDKKRAKEIKSSP